MGTISAGVALSASAAEVDPTAAKNQFVKACAVCHAVEPNAPARQGPHLFGVFGRKAGSLPDFKYSAALKETDLVWTEETLDRWIENPQTMRPGTTMLYKQADPDKRRLVIEYLKTLGPTKPSAAAATPEWRS